MKLLKEQIKATRPQLNIWLSANAGTGKTHVLVNRFLRLLLDGNEPHRIVCITFTKAAAAEMQSRIIETISELILLDDISLKNKLEEKFEEKFELKKLARAKINLANILDFPEQLRIQTIHAFCQGTLKSFPLEAGIPPFFNVIDDIVAEELLGEAWKKQIDNKQNESLGFLLARFQLFSIKKLFQELIYERERIFALIQGKGGLNEYIGFLKARLGVGDDDISRIEHELKTAAQETVNNIMQAQIVAFNKDVSNALEMYGKTKNIEELGTIFNTQQGSFRGYYNQKKFAEKFPQLSLLAAEFSHKVTEVLDRKRDIELFNITKNVLIVFSSFCETYEKLKKQKYLLDYDDLIQKTAELLDKRNPNSAWVLYKLDGGIDHILLDEAQDTSPNQWKVIDALTGEYFSGEGAKNKAGSLFVVGDEKQSIYSFQGADVEVFSERKIRFEKLGTENIEVKFESLSLDTSFRSCKAVIDIVNNVLANDKVNKAVTVSGIKEHLISRKDKFGYFEINKLCGNDVKSDHSKERISWQLPREYITEDELKNKEIVANQVVQRVDDILNRSYALASTCAKPLPGDIMILLKKRDELCDMIIRKLQEKNIPTSGIDRLNLNDNLVIKDLIALGKFILLPNDDLNFASLLKSPLFEISEEHLFELCYKRESSVYASLSKNNKFKNIRDKIEEVRSSAQDNSCFAFYFNVIEVLGLRGSFISYFGTQANEIIDEFLGIVKNYETTISHSLQNFIGWFEKGDIEIKRNLNNKQGEVRILTVHGAKGLEAPIVIIPDSTSTSNSLFKFGFSGDLFLCPMSKNYKNELCREVENIYDIKEEDEYYRLLYVALTRARDELYIFGYKPRSSNTETWHNIVMDAVKDVVHEDGERFIYTSESYLNSVIPAAKDKLTEGKKLEFGEYKKEKEVEVISPSALYRADDRKGLSTTNVDFAWGSAAHKLLEVLPNIEEGKKQEAATVLLKDYPELDEVQKQKITAEALGTLNNPEFKFVFGGNSRAEVPICGMIGDKYISGKIDRLIESENEIIVIDYKTNKINEADIAEASEKYRGQLEAYKALLGKIYVNKNIKTALLFTAIGKINYL